MAYRDSSLRLDNRYMQRDRMNHHPEQRCMICQKLNPETDRGTPPSDWSLTTDKDGEVYGVICPTCITGELLSLATEDCLTAYAAQAAPWVAGQLMLRCWSPKFEAQTLPLRAAPRAGTQRQS